MMICAYFMTVLYCLCAYASWSYYACLMWFGSLVWFWYSCDSCVWVFVHHLDVLTICWELVFASLVCLLTFFMMLALFCACMGTLSLPLCTSTYYCTLKMNLYLLLFVYLHLSPACDFLASLCTCVHFLNLNLMLCCYALALSFTLNLIFFAHAAYTMCWAWIYGFDLVGSWLWAWF